jgi:hypothetical protein
MSLLFTYSQAEQPALIRLSGEIRDELKKPVSYAHIIEKSRNEGWISDYYGNFNADVLPGDTLLVSAVSFHQAMICIPREIRDSNYSIEMILQPDTVQLKELIIYPWPATYSLLKREFLNVDVNDPDSEINMYMPSMKDIAAMLKTPGVPGQIGLYSGPGPISILHDHFGKEARNKRNYEMEMKREKVYGRYNRVTVSRVTGLTKEEDIVKFMEYCALQVKFILESTDYELFSAILKCYHEFCQAGFIEKPGG